MARRGSTHGCTPTLAAPNTPFIRGVSRLAMVASVRRIYQPGAKFDHMTNFANSPEGQGKSQGLQVLYSREFFSDSSILGVTDKEFQEAVRGRWCIEAADLSGMKRAEVERVKAQITREADRARPAYGRATIDAPRSCILYGTTNDEEYLQLADRQLVVPAVQGRPRQGR